MRKYAYKLNILYQRANKLLMMLSLKKKSIHILFLHTIKLNSTKTSINRQILISSQFPGVVNVIYQLKPITSTNIND